jgi:hypothetical protein
LFAGGVGTFLLCLFAGCGFAGRRSNAETNALANLGKISCSAKASAATSHGFIVA